MPEYDEKSILKVTKSIRSSNVLKTAEGIMAEKRVEVFKGATATKVLLQKNIAKDEADAHRYLQKMLEHGHILRVSPINSTRFLQPDMNRNWDDSAFFAWIFEGSQLYTILGALLLLVVAFALVMYPLWPRRIRSVTWYLMILLSSLLGLLLVIAVIRLIVFVITFFTKSPGIWIFPRLFDDVGIIDSFIPLWAWHVPSSS